MTTLVKLLTNLDIADELKGLTAQTIFAPSDEAFANLPAGTLKNWTTKQKKEIVLRHVVDGITILGRDVMTGPVKTIGGEFIDLYLNDEPSFEEVDRGVKIDYKNKRISVVTYDLMASNGVIHVIDQVILPGKLPIGR